jgi:hypothetical protein
LLHRPGPPGSTQPPRVTSFFVVRFPSPFFVCPLEKGLSMLRIQPVGYALVTAPSYAAGVDWAALQAAGGAPWHADPPFAACQTPYGPHWTEAGYWVTPARYPLEHVSSALTIENALWQRNLLLQAGVGYEHVGMLVVYGQDSAKGASLQAVMPAVWASAEYGKLVDKKRSLMGLDS